jgi:alkylation response protein AidB-like acyl-CoA dehydrogenase
MAQLLSRRDLQFLLHEWLEVERLTERPRYAEGSRDVFDEVLELAERVATDRFAPHNREADANEPHLDDAGRVVLIPAVAEALQTFAETGLIGIALPESIGGMQLPHVIQSAAFAWFQAANVGTSGYPFLTLAAANMLLACGSEEQVATWVPSMLEGRCFGTMCLSETQAGSSLADITTRAEPQEDETYRLFGTKMWISGGEHELSENIAHMVLAKIPGAPAGVKGISLFIVPRFLLSEDGDGGLGVRNDVVLAGLNHKMGFRGTVNTVLGFGEGVHTPGARAGAVGYLVGEPGRGLTYMFHMMNEARIGVGLGAVALGYTGYLKTVQYARERPQGRPLTGRDPSSRQIPIIEHADVRRMLLAQKAYVEGGLALVLYAARLVDEQQSAAPAEAERATLLLEMLTPIAKSWPSQWCLEANSLAIQVHGGYGYAREYDVEQHYRDNRLNPIHEGTHGIQALDLLGRKVTMQSGAGLALLLSTIDATVRRARDAGEDEYADAVAAVIARLGEVTATIWSSGDPELALANATVYLEAAGHIVVAWIWLEQLLAAGSGEGAFYEGKRAAARYFFRYELPRVGPQLDLLATLDRTTLDAHPDWFADTSSHVSV